MAILASGCAPPLEAPRAPAPPRAQPIAVAVVRAHGGGDSRVVCASVEPGPDGAATGAAVLHAAFGDVPTLDGPDGARVCALGGFPAEGCASGGSWRHLVVRGGARPVETVLDPARYSLNHGDLDAWLWEERGGDRYGIGTSFAEVCDAP